MRTATFLQSAVSARRERPLLIAEPDGLEIINLSAALLLTLAFLPYGLQIIRDGYPHSRALGEEGGGDSDRPVPSAQW